MPKFHVIAGPDSTPVYPSVRKIGPADLKDALAKGVEDFLTTRFSRPDLPDRRHWAPCQQSSAFALPAHVGICSGWSLRGNWLV